MLVMIMILKNVQVERWRIAVRECYNYFSCFRWAAVSPNLSVIFYMFAAVKFDVECGGF